MSYDPQARRDTPLALALKARIRTDGPITVQDYMQACLLDPEHGYYRTRTAIGRAGDFITAPEISQIFGELLGLWAAVVWQQMGAPERLQLVELGPGRGTLMRDALRAAARVPAFRGALDVVLVETSEVLAGQQRATLADCGVPVRWTRELSGLAPRLATIVIGNEFLDALPGAQYVLAEPGMYARCVGLDAADRLVFTTSSDLLPVDPDAARRHDWWRAGGILEVAAAGAVLHPLRRLLATVPTAIVFIDYGHPATAAGDTLQAVRGHAFEHPLCSPGEADLTMAVDFEALVGHLVPPGLVDGPVTQAAFLGSLGVVERASRLMAANPGQAAAIEAGVARLMAPTGMGSRFKAIGVRSPGLPPLPGLLPLPDAGGAPPVDSRRPLS